jgi:hypothetical protein
MGKKSRPAPPPAPDYVGLARQEAEANQRNLTNQTWANRPTINTPWGSQTWEATEGVDPATGQRVTQWTSNITLSPQQQAALDSQMAVQMGLSNQAQQFLGRVGAAMGQPFDWSSLPAAATGLTPQLTGTGPALQTSFASGGPITNQIGDAGEIARAFAGGGPLRKSVGGSGDYVSQAGDALYNQARSRLDPQFQQREADLEASLLNRGIVRGSEAWNREFDNLNRHRTDAYNDAAFRAAQLAGAEAARLQGMDIHAGQFQNQAAGQEFNQNAALAHFQNQAQQQAFNQLAQRAAFQNQAAGEAFNQNAALAQFQNQALQHMFANQLAANQQNFHQLQQQQEFQQRLRQQAIAEQQMARSQPLNELNALLTGQQVGMPQMPSFHSAGMAATPNLLGAANMGYNAALGAYNAELANQQAARQGLFGAIGTAANIARMFGFSDRRLKSRVHRIGTTARGTPLYIYNMHGRTQIGVLAQEAPPHAVIEIGGLLAVDYNEV